MAAVSTRSSSLRTIPEHLWFGKKVQPERRTGVEMYRKGERWEYTYYSMEERLEAERGFVGVLVWDKMKRKVGDSIIGGTGIEKGEFIEFGR